MTSLWHRLRGKCAPVFLALALAALAPLGQVIEAASPASAATSGTVTAGVITISKITLVPTTGSEVVLSQATITTNLLTLANDTVTLTQDGVVPAGTYGQLRFYLSGGYVQSSDGNIYATSPTYQGLPQGATVNGLLKLPAFLKVLPASTTVSTSTDSKLLLTDFDVSQVFGGLAGNSSSWVLGKVIQGGSFTFTGNLSVTVSLAAGVTLPTLNGTQVTLGDFSAVLTNAGGATKTLSLAPIAPDSSTFGASFKYLLPGSFTIALQAPAGMSFASSPSSPADNAVSSGQETQQAFTITSASAP
jgi:Domain of unknown function (DUF4382)